MPGSRFVAGCIVLLVATSSWASDPAPPIRWDFSAEETAPLRSHGGVHRDVPGPRPPTYPDFEAGNTAVKLDGTGAHLSVEDSGPQSPYDFSNGDAITLEAWVQVEEIRAGEFVYVIGKGRTGAKGFPADNQNWALRLRESQGKCCVSFLFATVPVPGATKSDAHWHRWSSDSGFTAGLGWHHIAVTYRFGEPQSLRGWIDGQPQPGKWDMGGTTTEKPVVDDDAVWIGSSRGGAAGNSFRGTLDAIMIRRQLVDDKWMQSRFRREGPEPVAQLQPEVMPDVGNLSPGAVLLTMHEGMPAHNRWLNVGEKLPPVTEQWSLEQFLVTQLPQRYDGWGIRTAWKPPVLVRLASDVQLAPGPHTFLVRVRGLCRLWVNGEVVACSKPALGSQDGEEAMTPVAPPPMPGLRRAEHRQQELLADVEIRDPGPTRVVLEMLAGGKTFRVDPGEACVAVKTADGGSFDLLSPSESAAPAVPLTDDAVLAAIARQDLALQALNDQNRRKAAASQDAFWQKRHQVARNWAHSHPAPSIPADRDETSVGGAARHPIDAFLDQKVQRALAASAQSPTEVAAHFYDVVLPILRTECFRCHGDKEQGGLRLNSRTAILKGGESEIPAVAPGNAAGSELIRRIKSADPDEQMPPGGSRLKPAEIAILEEWIQSGASWPAPPLAQEDVSPPAVIGDAAFLRRVSLDTIGVPATANDVRQFLADSSPNKRQRVVDQLLDDDRWADHWVSYWQDVLAENPSLINASLNTTGPFRWYLYEALRDQKPFDRLVTELILLRGTSAEGGSAGFGVASENDAPFAVKGQVVATAFLGIELQCARCHDSPYHSTKQRDLYGLAAMFERRPVTVPKTSRVPNAFFEAKVREPLIKVTLKPDEPVAPHWPFAEVTGSIDDAALASLLQDPEDQRERLAALITSPNNQRFAQVIVNRLWRRFMGAGFVEPVQDWEGHAPSHPELLDWLAREFVAHDYDLKHVARLILTSQVYQREATGKNLSAAPEVRFFVAPDRRRLTAEQVVDSLHAATGQPMDVEVLTFDPDGRRAAASRLKLDAPRRAWMFTSLANERDRPSLSLPRARAVADILEAFGWSGSRQNARTDRETAPNVLQPGALANTIAAVNLTRASCHSDLAELAIHATSPGELVDTLFLRFLGRLPTEPEKESLIKVLAVQFDERLVPATEVQWPAPPEPLPAVTWSNHLRSEANSIALELERRVRLGPPPDPRLRPNWREAYEDVVWSLLNLREFVWIP